jgi:HTH-type transcriptional regulator/antitoxin HigA
MADRVPAQVFPPGDLIEEEIDARGWTQQDLADILHKPLPTVNQIIKGKRAILPDTAKRLAAAFGNSAQFWMNLEAAWQLSRQDSAETDKVRSRAQIYKLAPVREMEKRGWIKSTTGHGALKAELSRFFGVETLEFLPAMMGAARASVNGQYAGMTASQWAWCRRACQIAPAVRAQRFQRSKVPDAVAALKELLCDPEEIRHVPTILANVGIRFVVVEHLKGTRIDGAALWPTQNKPVIVVSLRYGRLDHFWFTLMHELAHIYHRDGIQADVNTAELGAAQVVEAAEVRANQQAATWLVDQDLLDVFILRTTPLYSTQRIGNFARRLGVNASIIVGQLKYRGQLEWPRFSRLHNVGIRDVACESVLCDGWGRAVLRF